MTKVKRFFNSEESLYLFLSLSLGTSFLGFAPSSIALGLFVFFSFRYAYIQKRTFSFKSALIFPMLLYFLFLCSLIWSKDLSQTILGIGRMISLLIVPLAFLCLPKTSKRGYQLFFTIFNAFNVFYGLLFLTTATIGFFKSKLLTAFTYHDLVSVLELNAIYVSIYFVVSIFYLLFQKQKNRTHWVLLAFFSGIVLLLSSKILIFITAIAYFYWMIKQSLSIKKTLLFVCLVGLGISIASIKLFDRIQFETTTKFDEVFEKEEFGPIYIWTGSSLRLFYLRLLNEQIYEDDIFWKGFGLFASKQNIIDRHKSYKTYIGFHNYNYHNQYAQVLSESGVFGFILLLLLLFSMIKSGVISNNTFWLFVAITFCLIFITESLLWRQRGLFLFVVLYCIFVKNKDKRQKIL